MSEYGRENVPMEGSGYGPELQSISPPCKRRKVRKGTQSCWECKRRKTRCIYAESDDPVCVGCKSRGTKCISQQFQDEAPGGRGKVDAFDRGRRRPRSAVSLECDTPRQLGSPVPLHAHQVPTHIERLSSSDHEAITQALLAAWPSQHDLETLLKFSSEPLSNLHGALCAQRFDPEKTPSIQEMLLLPPARSHPLILAQRLLVLGIYLQSIPTNAHDLEDLSVNHRALMSRAVDTAVRLVTSNDELVNSIEGIESVMTESMYHNNAGNLRRAYLSMRRAIVLAQMMGLHKHPTARPSLKVIDPETRIRIDPEHMWFRLVSSDRYLSMMLGLPQGSVESTFASPSSLESCTPIERMERLDSVAGGRILQRNDTDMLDLAMTREIDSLLQKAASCMPPRWWLIPSLEATASDETKISHEITRMMHQLAHYHILAQLHLPYLLRFSADRKYDDSKITAINASREILARFVAFKNYQSTGSYCRGVDFLAFIASTTLCLAHIDSRRRHGDARLAFLAHQRPGDRGMMVKTQEAMESMAQTDDDAIASRIANILQHLLAIEADTSGLATYSTNSTPSESEVELDCGGKVSDGGDILNIHIPCYGTIKIERNPVAFEPSLVHEVLDNTGSEDASFSFSWLDQDPNDSVLQGVDTTFFDNIIGQPIRSDGSVETWPQWVNIQ